MTRWLLRYDDELFGLLYYDVDNLAQSFATEVFDQGRSVSVYGVRGIGKTTLMQGIIWHGLKNAGNKKFLPVPVSVTGANSVASLTDLENRFYRSVLSGLIFSGAISERYEQVKKRLNEYVPWVAASGLAAISLVFPPAALASEIAKNGIKKLLAKAGIKDSEKLVASSELEPKFAVDFIIKELEENDVHPIFVIDELDKVVNDSMLSDFFDGHQGWFQGKRTIISLSHTFGQSIEDAVVTSIKRFSSVQRISGVTNPDQLKSIVQLRLLLGISQVKHSESEAKTAADGLISYEVYEKILNNFVPILHLMLEVIHESLKKARINKKTYVALQDIVDEKENNAIRPTKLELTILNKLAESKMSPTDLANSLSKERSTISRALKSLLIKKLIGRTGKGKSVYYFLRQKGESARHLTQV